MQKSMHSETGIALLVALLATTVLSAWGVAIVLATITESRIASNFRSSREGFYAANAVGELAFAELVALPDWTLVLNGLARTTLVDGPPAGGRTLSDGTPVDLGVIVNLANCAQSTACSDADMNAITPDRPWGAQNPRWVLVAYGRLLDMLPAGTVESSSYVMLMAAADPFHTPDVLALRAESFGRSGAHNTVEWTIARTPTVARILAWREVR